MWSDLSCQKKEAGLKETRPKRVTRNISLVRLDMTFNKIQRQATLRRGIFSVRVFYGLLLFLAAFVLLSSTSASAQLAGKGEIKGVVTDSSGAVIPGAVVTATSTTQGTKVTRTTSGSGDFDITALNADIYIISVAAKGFETLTQQDVHVNALEVADLKLAMTIGSESQSINVSAAPPQLETSNATLGATIEHDMYSALPIEMGAYGQPDQRRATDFAFLMPGVQGNNTNGNPTTNVGIINGSGSRGAAAAVYVDGIPFVRAGGNGDPRYVWTAISVDAVDQFNLQTNGYSAIYEGQGIQNFNIKQGGNKYHGAAYEFFRNTALDTWGFFGALPSPTTGLVSKPIEHSNEYGVVLSGPLVPVGSWKDKLFFFGNYDGFKYSSQTPTAMTFPTAAEQGGNFAGISPLGIFDPSTQAACTANSTDGPCRYRYGYTGGTGKGSRGNPHQTGPVDVIPASQISPIVKNLESFLPSGIGTSATNNYVAPNFTGLTNWSTTDRIDYNVTSKDTLTFLAAIGRQASAVPQGQQTAGRNVGPVPYSYGQAFAPKTAVGIIEETHVFSSHIVNQFKYGYARYNGPTFNPNFAPAYASSALGINGLPAGQAAGGFPTVNFAGTAAPTNWSGAQANITIAENYTLLDNVQWNLGKHSLTIGGQVAWLLYQVTPDTGGSSFLTIANAVSETAGFNSSTNNSIAATANTGLSYASFLIGQIDKGSFTQTLVQEYGSRFRAISPYVQDNWKVTEKLTLDLGLRYDFFPSLREAHDNMSFFNPNLPNPITGINGALQFTGTGANTCNCHTPVNNYYKNLGPRVGIAYQIDPKTVIRGSYGVMYTHGNAVGGGNNITAGGSGNSLGFAASPSASSNSSLLSTFPLTATSSAFPAYTAATGRASGPAFGTGFTTTNGFTAAPSGVSYFDPYLGGRAPQYINWSFGFQHQWTDAIVTNIAYVGSQGHFLISDGGNARGFWADQLDPKYLVYQSNLALSGPAATAFCNANNLPCPANFTSGQNLGTALKPFPFNAVSDYMGNVSNANYNALQVTANMRPSHGLTFMANYTWARTIDDGGSFRTGYAIPANVSGTGKPWAADAIERTISTSNQPHHVVITGVWNLPIGSSVLGGNALERAVFGGFKFSEIFQAYSGSPLPITGNSCGTNPAQGTCMPTYNPNFAGPAHIHGKWGQGVTAASAGIANTATPLTQSSANQFIDVSAFSTTPAYTFGNTSRTAPYNLYGPGNYQLDIGLARSFPLHFTESARFNFRAEMYNVTNHTLFGVASTAWGATNFGQVTTNANYNRRSAQLSARVEF
jgi:carboxypeptidase family protein/TonB-dependent receptor-like protein